jgi:hypothetical protein
MAACIRDNHLKRPPPGVIGQLVALSLQLQSMPLEFAPLPYDRTPPVDLDRRLLAAYREAIQAYDLETDHLKKITPPLCDDAAIACVLAYLKHWPGADSGPFSVRYADAVNIAQVSFEMMEPLRHPELKKVEAFKAVRDAFHENAKAVSRRQLKRQMDGPLYPQDYDGPRETIPEIYFKGTPFRELLETEVPYPLFDQTRYATHWVLGAQGQGKSTFLSNLLRYDLERVKRQQCSLIIMDSQAEKGLARNVAQLPIFEKGGELEGQLIYIHPRYPVALNAFKLKAKDDAYINGAIAIFEYFFGTALGAEFTALQGGPIRDILKALFDDPEPSLDKFVELIRAADIEKRSKDGIVSRLRALRSFSAIDRMLNASSNKLDLEDAIASNKVICIDVDQGFLVDESLIELYARLFIALALQATMRRGTNPKPAFFMIDEAQDFIKNDDKVAKLIFQARKQNFGLIIAHHDLEQIDSKQVRTALQKSAIKTECNKRRANMWIENAKHPTSVRVADVKYGEDAPKSALWDETLAEQIARYGAKPPTPPGSPAVPRTSEDEPMDYSKA